MLSKLIFSILVLAIFSMAGCIESDSTTAPDNELGPYFDGLGDWVWLDKNQNGVQDEAEPGIDGIVVSLLDCEGNLVMSVTTHGGGNYELDGFESGDYQIHFSRPEGYVFTTMRAESDITLDSDVDPTTGSTECLTLEAGVIERDIDAGLYYEVVAAGCAHGKGYWKNHLDEVAELLTVFLGTEDGEKSLIVDSSQVAFDILQQHTYGAPSNGITKLYAHLLTAKLSIANGADGADAEAAIDDADAFLNDHDWNDWDELSRDDKHLVQGMIGSFHVSSASDDCPEDDEEDEE